MITRATHLRAYTDLLQAIGAPVERELQRARLPAMLANQPDAYIPVLPGLKFVKRMEHKEGLDDIAFLASQQFSFDNLSDEFITLCQSVPSLYSRFQLFSNLVPLENSHARVFLIREEKDFRVCFNLLGHPHMDGLHYSEWQHINGLAAVVQKTLGQRWRPAEITFQSKFVPCDAAFEKFPNTRFLFGQKNTSITVSASLMSRSLNDGQGKPEFHQGLVSAQSSQRPQQSLALDYPESLKLLLRSYIQQSYPDVNLAAEIASTSVRTMQRRLGQYGLNYSSLVQQARFEVATEMLADPSVKIIDIAHAIGYSDPSHFARSFRRISGVSPGEYRRQHFKN
ncbi:MAG: helix-turn-helix domain-containing protein [Pseudomonadota bacterium]|nr:helix-turn-helix domain-containing protein [Pseudomonadota bacterium]